MSATNESDDHKNEIFKSNRNFVDDLAESQSKVNQLEEKRKSSLRPKLMRRKSIDLESRLNRMYVILIFIQNRHELTVVKTN